MTRSSATSRRRAPRPSSTRSTARCGPRCRRKAPPRPRSSSAPSGALRDDGRPRGRAPGAQRRVRGAEREKLPAPQVDRRRLDVRPDGADPRELGHGLRRRQFRRGPARLPRARLDHRRGMGRRPLARGARRRDAHLRIRLLRHARRQAALVSLDHAGGRGRRAALARRVVRVLGSTSTKSRPSALSTARSPARSCSSAGSG